MNIGNRLLGYFLVITLFVITAISLEVNKEKITPKATEEKSIIEAVLKSKIDSLKAFENSFNDCIKESVLNNRTANNYYQKKKFHELCTHIAFFLYIFIYWLHNYF